MKGRAVLSIDHLTLSHFRSHQVTKLDVSPAPVALFGANGAGKTNVLEAVSMLSPGRGLRRATSDELIRQPQRLGWKIKAQILSGVQSHAIETWAEPGSNRQVRIDEKAVSQVQLGRLVRVLWLIPAMDRLWIEGAEGRRRFLDRMTLSFHPSHAEHTLAYEKAMRDRNRLLKDLVRDPSWYRALEGRMAEAAEAIQKARNATIEALHTAQAATQTAFPASHLAIAHPEVALPQRQEDLLRAWEDTRRRDLAAGRTLIGPHRVDLEATYRTKDIPARAASTGEQKALLVSLILANARALAEQIGSPPLLLLDEVTAHLDADRQTALYDEVVALGAQAWMTGTGPELFDALGDRAQRFEVSEDQDGSQLKVVP